MTAKELKEELDKLIKQGKGDYLITYDAFCCETCNKDKLNVSDKLKAVDVS